jgi:hypothetical protein
MAGVRNRIARAIANVFEPLVMGRSLLSAAYL